MTDLFYGHFKDIPIVQCYNCQSFKKSKKKFRVKHPPTKCKKAHQHFIIKKTCQEYFQTVVRSCSLKFFLFFRFLLWYQMSALQPLQQKWLKFVWTMRRLLSHHFTDMQGRWKVQKWGRGLDRYTPAEVQIISDKNAWAWHSVLKQI